MTLVLRVAGVTWHQREALGVVKMCAECPPQFRLVPEPTNEHDRNAVRIEAAVHRARTDAEIWCHLGYVPRAQAALVADLLAAGRVKDVALAGHGTIQADDFVPWLRIKLEVL